MNKQKRKGTSLAERWRNDDEPFKILEEPEEDTKKSFSIYKTDDDKRLVFGWASISITVDGEQLEDRQKDMIDPEDLEEAVYDYVLNFRDTGEEHIPTMRKKGKLVESCVFTAEKQKAMGIPEGTLPIGWWIGFKIEDDAAWERVKNGTYKMFSIEGKANREPVEKSVENVENPARVAKTFSEILEIRKFNPYHDSKGRFASASGGSSGAAGSTLNTDRYKDLIPTNSYVNSKEYKQAVQIAREAMETHDAVWKELREIEDQLKAESAPKPKSQWTIDDEIDSIMGERPKIYTEKGRQLKERLDEARSEAVKTMNEKDAALKTLDNIKSKNHEQQAADHEYRMPKKATQTEYDGFKIDDTGTSHGDELLKRGYLAEMSPKEYLERCAFEIFNGATIESTIQGTEASNVAKYTQMMKDGVKFDTPYLDYVGGGQEGRHRAMAAYNLGIEKIPVVVRDSPVSNALTKKPTSSKASNIEEMEELDDEWLLLD